MTRPSLGCSSSPVLGADRTVPCTSHKGVPSPLLTYTSADPPQHPLTLREKPRPPATFSSSLCPQGAEYAQGSMARDDGSAVLSGCVSPEESTTVVSKATTRRGRSGDLRLELAPTREGRRLGLRARAGCSAPGAAPWSKVAARRGAGRQRQPAALSLPAAPGRGRRKMEVDVAEKGLMLTQMTRLRITMIGHMELPPRPC